MRDDRIPENRIDLLPWYLGSSVDHVYVDTIFRVRHTCHSWHRSHHAHCVGGCSYLSRIGAWRCRCFTNPAAPRGSRLVDTRLRCRRLLCGGIHLCSDKVAVMPNSPSATGGNGCTFTLSPANLVD